jgi:hypothetical protein
LSVVVEQSTKADSRVLFGHSLRRLGDALAIVHDALRNAAFTPWKWVAPL